MRRHLPLLAALGAFAALVAAVVAVAASSAGGTPGGGLGSLSPRAGSGTQPLPRPACRLPRERGPSALPVRGVCAGTLSGAFRCVNGGEFVALSIRRSLDARNSFYLTVLVPEYAGPGGYPESEVFAQIVGPAESPRWTQRDAITRVSSDGSVELGRFVLKPEPGTPGWGTLSVSGRAVCAAADREFAAVRPKR